MKNTFINDYRRRARQNTISEENIHPILNQLKSHQNYDPSSIYETKELEKIVESIDEKLKVPFKMQHEGYKYKEIAEILDIKVGTVKSRIFIARQKLMKHLI